MTEHDLDTYFEVAKNLVTEAGQLLYKNFHDRSRVVERKSQLDLVTDTDQAIENLLINGLKSHFPSHKFIAEEATSSADGRIEYSEDPTWIIDPLDGTTNFVHRFPLVCISCALAINRDVKIALVFNPVINEFYTAIKGRGAFCNGQPIRVSGVDQLSDALLGTNFGVSRKEDFVDFMLGNFRQLLENKVLALRCCGSAAMDMVGVACGRLDGFYELGIWPWDIAAGKLLVEEAGGVVVNLRAEPLDLLSRQVLCGSRSLVDQVAALLIEAPALVKPPPASSS